MSSIGSIDTELTPEVKANRQAQYPVSPLFLNRWSPRSFKNDKISEQHLNAILEAAHWAPSSFNDQPWRFIVADTDEQLNVFHQILNDFNRSWADKAPVLVLVASDKLRANGDPNGAHAFDAGTAWGYIALQASLLGIASHAIGGFDRDKARTLLNIPDQYELHAMVALGYQDDRSKLPEGMREREEPNTRVDLDKVVFRGKL
ncbi:nitroreductase family protein [Paenibacillus thalictri]|uniref:Nitroreductase n=1 Tax=Paenibacillus thalictri TaxID=2527873 RepID=A0A4V2J404_9BACL|nr:nitroreductase family protein [Paenibacillus thalictri]TBL76575.1 nitroreductase [Paenibacillus thalictri]